MKTAVQQLAEQMEHPNIFNPFIAKALEIEKEQIVNAYNKGKSNVFSSSYNAFWRGEDYFNDTYKNVSK